MSLYGPPILFCDLDGTVRHGKDELGRFVNTAEDVVIFPDALELIGKWRRAGGVAVGVTNQGGVGLGYITKSEHARITARTQDESGLDHIVSCIHGPDDGCWCRKPMAGLIFQALDWVSDVCGDFPPRSKCLMVGDRDEDYLTAAKACVPFLSARNWRATA